VKLTQAGLCEGYGGLSMAVTEVLGAELTWYSEIDPAACTLLAHHHPTLTNHGDLTEADWSKAEPVDILTGGWPCQPWSLAGQRKGAADERAIWPHVARAVRALRPRLVLLENVASIAPAGELARAAGDLAALGYVGSWRRVRASDVGAPHQRARIFIVARPATADTGSLRWGKGARTTVRRAASVRREAGQDADHGDGVASDAASVGRGEGRPEPARLVGGSDAAQRRDADSDAVGLRCGTEGRHDGVRPAGLVEIAAADPDGDGLTLVGQGTELDARDDADGRSQVDRVDWAGYAPAIERWEHVTGRRAPAPTVLGARGGRQLSARFAEWLMGLPEGHVTDVPGITRNAQLKLCGNGVVWQQAAYALRLLLAADTGSVAA
jgi:DNA (cytosine-5)-methyltransferase 1